MGTRDLDWDVSWGCLGQKSCRTKVSRIFRFFVLNFAPNFAPNFPRIFRGVFVLRFVGDGDQKKFTKNPCHFSMQNSQPNTKKIFTKFFWRAGRVRDAQESEKQIVFKLWPLANYPLCTLKKSGKSGPPQWNNKPPTMQHGSTWPEMLDKKTLEESISRNSILTRHSCQFHNPRNGVLVFLSKRALQLFWIQLNVSS